MGRPRSKCVLHVGVFGMARNTMGNGMAGSLASRTRDHAVFVTRASFRETCRQMLMKHHRVPRLAILWPHHMKNIRRARSQAAHSTDGAYPCSTVRPTLKRRSSQATPSETYSRIRDETMTPTHRLRRGARHRNHNQHHHIPEIRPRQP